MQTAYSLTDWIQMGHSKKKVLFEIDFFSSKKNYLLVCMYQSWYDVPTLQLEFNFIINNNIMACFFRHFLSFTTFFSAKTNVVNKQKENGAMSSLIPNFQFEFFKLVLPTFVKWQQKWILAKDTINILNNFVKNLYNESTRNFKGMA